MFPYEAVPKLKFWNSNLGFTGKNGPDFSPIRPRFPGACGKTIGFGTGSHYMVVFLFCQ
jgi:hypothetical protein